jgi:hypothetical protein
MSVSSSLIVKLVGAGFDNNFSSNLDFFGTAIHLATIL